MKKPIDKEYLENSLKSFGSEVLDRTYLRKDDTALHTHDNETTLNKISETADGTLLFDGKEIKNGVDGINGVDGTDGKSAYDIAVEHGFSGSEEEWLESLKGEKGDPGNNGVNGADGQSGATYDILATSDAVKENTAEGKLVDALVVKEVFQSVSDGKKLIASAITDKGVETDANDTFTVMAENIAVISSSSSALKVTWDVATDEELAAALDAHYAGVIDIADCWNVGDTRTIHLSSMGSWQVGTDKNGETHTAQDVEVVIIGFGVDDLVNPINGISKAAITVQLKNVLPNKGMIDYNFENYTNNNSTFTANWSTCARRNWTNTIFKNSLPTTLQSVLKQVSKTAYGYKYSYSSSGWNATYTSKQFSQDYCFLLSPKETGVNEIFIKDVSLQGFKEGDIEYDYLADGNIYEYYQDEKNIPKDYVWWTRFPAFSNSLPSWRTICGKSIGAAVYRASYGIAPAFCL